MRNSNSCCYIIYSYIHIALFLMLFLICRKENTNERKENLLSICRVQLFYCKDTTFLFNLQMFRRKILENNISLLIRSKVGGVSKPSLCFAGWDRLGTFKGKRVKNLWKSVESVGQQQGRNCPLIS